MQTRSVAIALVGVLVLLAGLGGDAAARRRTRVAVLEMSIEGDAPPELRGQLDRSLAGGLYAAGYEVVGRDEVAEKLRGAPELVGCLTTTCLERIGALVGASRFVRAHVETAGAAYTFELELLGAEASGAVLRRVERHCAVCTIAEANDEMSRAAAALREDAPTKVTLTIRTEPPGALVSIDGRELGRAPQTVEVAPGEHVVRATMRGRTATQKQVDLRDDRAEVTLSLPPGDGPAPGAESRHGAWKWVTGGAAVAALVGGVWLITIDGDGTNCPGDGRPCRDLYDTLVGGVILTGAGVALGGLTIYLFANDRPRATEPRLTLVPSPTGIRASFTLEF